LIVCITFIFIIFYVIIIAVKITIDKNLTRKATQWLKLEPLGGFKIYKKNNSPINPALPKNTLV